MNAIATSVWSSRFHSPAGVVEVVHDGERALSIGPASGPSAPGSLPPALERALREAVDSRPSAPPALRGVDEGDRRVLLAAFGIPRGQVRSYAWLAAATGRPGEAREVAAALSRNPLPLLVPCHRVIQSDFRLGWYSCGGARAKRALLAHEGVNLDLLDELVRRRARYVADAASGRYCHPTCRDLGTPRHRLLVPSAGAAEAAGFRACPACRPRELH
jgi:methylated-DNA-[protein]-cysteine S-methyltransferase